MNFRELVVEGPERMVRGFVAGALCATSHGKLLYNDDEHIEAGRFVETLAEWVGLREHLVHLILDDDSASCVVGAMEKEHGLPLKVRSDRAVVSAGFSFHYEIFAPAYAQKVHGLLEARAAAVNLEGFEPKIELDAAAEATELYSPEHPWAEKAEGSVSGPLAEVIELYRGLCDEPLVKLDDVSLEFSEE